jgi:hypothetical protein
LIKQDFQAAFYQLPGKRRYFYTLRLPGMYKLQQKAIIERDAFFENAFDPIFIFVILDWRFCLKGRQPG